MRGGRHGKLHLILLVDLTRTNFFKATETLDYLEFGVITLTNFSDRLSFENLVQIDRVYMLNCLSAGLCLALRRDITL